jgi:DNA repair protein RecN (Recombination protein N)
MISFLKIENLALIRHTEVDFAPGLNVITGETGAGKSILLGAIGLLLGARADRTVIRAGAERCEICGLFQLPPAAAAAVAPLLEKRDIPFDPAAPELAIRRIIAETSGRCHVNDTPVTVKTLQELGELLIDVHSANEHQSLTSKACQLELLDRYAGADGPVAVCAEAFRQLAALRREEAAFAAGLPSPAEAAQLAMIIEDIEKVDPKSGEDEELATRHGLAANARQIIADSAELATMLSDGENSMLDQLSGVYRKLQELTRFDAVRGGELQEICGIATEQLRELAERIADFGSGLELDEAAFAELEHRLSLLYTLKRRYGPSLDQVIDALTDARARLDDYRRGDEKRAEFKRREADFRQKLAAAADELSRLRRSKAAQLAAEVEEKLQHLGFPAGRIEAQFTDIEPGPNGRDALELLFSANAGEAPQPLRKIASSGELSRLMLALKTVLSDADRIPVAVFDEIDVNIGGETATKVADELRKLAVRRQLLAISHLPQVAAKGDVHFVVSKCDEAGRTVSTILRLDADGRRREIARMLGGGQAADIHARDLLKHR